MPDPSHDSERERLVKAHAYCRRLFDGIWLAMALVPITLGLVSWLFTGKLEHLYDAVVEAKASAVLAASIFHFGEISIPEAKRYLKEKGIPVKI